MRLHFHKKNDDAVAIAVIESYIYRSCGGLILGVLSLVLPEQVRRPNDVVTLMEAAEAAGDGDYLVIEGVIRLGVSALAHHIAAGRWHEVREAARVLEESLAVQAHALVLFATHNEDLAERALSCRLRFLSDAEDLAETLGVSVDYLRSEFTVGGDFGVFIADPEGKEPDLGDV